MYCPFTKHHTFTIQAGRAIFPSGKRVEMAAHIYNDKMSLVAVIAVNGSGADALAVARSWLDLVFGLDIQRAEVQRRRAAAQAAQLEAARLDDERRRTEVRERAERAHEQAIADQMRANMVSASKVGRRYDPRPNVDRDRMRRIRGY
jgi:hypothetical protein